MVKFLPWSVETVQGGPKIYAGGGSDHAICQLFSRDGVAFLDANENAALIVKAVNNHEMLVKTLSDLLEANKTLASLSPHHHNRNAAIAGQEVAERDARDLLAAVVGGSGT